MKPSNLSRHVQNFLQEYLTLKRGYSRNTILSYRDTIKLLLIHHADREKKNVTDIALSDLDVDSVTEFLEYLESGRHNSVSTRNARLACIHSFFRYVAHYEPLIFDQCQHVLTLPFKREQVPMVGYLEREEMKAILDATNHSNSDCFRDHVLFHFMYNTGARAQEVVDLNVKAVQLERPCQVRFLGKGRKERLCPLWPETANLLRSFLKRRGIAGNMEAAVFTNHRGQPLTRFGIRYLLRKYSHLAAQKCLSLKEKNIHPHTIRHTTAMHLLQSGVDINTIRAWLGHADLMTTNRYAEINLDMKRKVLEKYSPLAKMASKPWKKNREILQWLESL